MGPFLLSLKVVPRSGWPRTSFPFRSWFEIKPFLSPCSPKGTGYEISVNPATPVDRRGGVLESSDQEATPSPRSRAHNAPDECPANSKMSSIVYAASQK